MQVDIQRTYLKPNAENMEQSRAAETIEEKRQYWKGRIDAAGQQRIVRVVAGAGLVRPA